MGEEQDEHRIYRVVVNDEEQYSVWFLDRDLPSGWRDAGWEGSREDCLEHIGRTWTDIRPLSLRSSLPTARATPG